MIVTYIVESTITAIILFWILSNAASFDTVVQSSVKATVGSVQALWGKN